MKVLFVCSANKKGIGIAPFICEQAESLRNKGIDVDYFPIVGKGISGYLKAAVKLRRYLKNGNFDLVHAHFTLSGWTAVLGAGRTPVVLSLMGDDAYGVYIRVNTIRPASRGLTLLTWLIQPFVKAIISKSENIEKYVYLKRKSYIIPNGINISRFREQTVLHVPTTRKKKVILFLGNKNEKRKNFPLAEAAVNMMAMPNVELINPYPVRHADIPALLNSADVLAVPSLMEGSPNVVKEAMACNCPIVVTDTGDARWVIGGTEGCFVSSFNLYEFSAKIKLALNYAETKGRTMGRARLIALGLDEASIAGRIIDVYRTVLTKDNVNLPVRRIATETNPVSGF